jgi:signal transduction histidine kinase/CheY-like chemotaxis protein
MAAPLRVVIVTALASDGERLAAGLERAGFAPDWQRVDTETAYRVALEAGPDLVLAGDAPQLSARRALDILQERTTDIPSIVLAKRETGAEDLPHHPADRLDPDDLERLAPVVGRVLELKGLRAAQRQAVADIDELCRERTQLQAALARVGALGAERIVREQQDRRRIAQDIQEELEQRLIAARFRVTLLQRTASAGDQALCRELAVLLEAGQDCSRRLVRELSPPIPYAAGLLPTLEWLARWMGEQHGMAVTVTADRNAVLDTEAAAILLVECISELLLNTGKHAGVREARLEILPRGDQVHIVVADAGSGFDPAVVAEGTGAGRGLVWVGQCLQHLGGRLEIDSAPGRGSRCVLQVPRRHSDRRAARPEVPRIRVLLVDDHTVLRQALAHLLRAQADMEVVGEAATGVAGLELAGRLHPDVVLMDVNMPAMNGVEATRLIHAQLPTVQVIALSMFEARGLASQAMQEAGAVAYLGKSDPPDRLLKAIRACAPRRG